MSTVLNDREGQIKRRDKARTGQKREKRGSGDGERIQEQMMGKEYKNNKRSNFRESNEKNQSDAWAYTKDPKCDCERSTVQKEPTNNVYKRPNPHIFFSNPLKLSGRNPVHARSQSMLLCKPCQDLRILACLEQNFQTPSRFVHIADNFGLG